MSHNIDVPPRYFCLSNHRAVGVLFLTTGLINVAVLLLRGDVIGLAGLPQVAIGIVFLRGYH